MNGLPSRLTFLVGLIIFTLSWCVSATTIAQASSTYQSYIGRSGTPQVAGIVDANFTIFLERAIDSEKKYLFPQFVYGRAYSNGEVVGTLKVNYHKLYGEVVFINLKDTLIISDNPPIDLIETQQKLFYRDRKEGSFEVLSPQSNDVWLMVKIILKVVRTQNIVDRDGGYYIDTRTMGKDSLYHALWKSKDPNKPVMDVTMKEEVTFYLLGHDKKLVKANRNGFLKIFSKSKPTLKDWIETNEIEFEKEMDLKKIYDFCVTN